MKKTALIMAGGRGERLWPKSRKALPKQFLCLTGDGKTMIQLTVERILPLVAMEDIYVCTNADYAELVAEQLPELPRENILCEPEGKNTAPCIGLGAAVMEKKYGEAVMFVLASDSYIKYNSIFINALKDAAAVAQAGENLVTVGITPDYPEVGYGYIRFDPTESIGRAFRVERFVEKPDIETARGYLATERYLWNSGMFIWKLSTVRNALREFMPAMCEGLERIQAALGTEHEQQVLQAEYAAMPKISIDYAVMEKAERIYTVPGSFGWNDVGSWQALDIIQSGNEFGNVVSGNAVTVDTRRCIIQGNDRLIATVGLENVVIVDTSDALLVCNKSDTANIKKILENLRICNRDEYL